MKIHGKELIDTAENGPFRVAPSGSAGFFAMLTKNTNAKSDQKADAKLIRRDQKANPRFD